MSNLPVFLLCTTLWMSFAQASVEQQIEKALQRIGDWKAHSTILIAEKPDRVLFAHQANEALIPASVTKIVTAAAVLKHFPPGTKMKTQILSAAPIEGEVLKGDLYLKGGGDPGFVSETMWFLVNHFLRSKIRKIEGNIVVDDRLFDSLRFDPSRQKERVDRAYDAPTSAMSFNWNSINVFVRPGLKVGDAASVFLDPENSYTELKADVKTVKAGGEASVDVERDETKTGDVVIVRGKIPVDSKEITVFKNITKPDLWSGSQLKSFLAQRGVQVSGGVKSGETPRDARVLAEAESKPVEQMIADMNKFSNNYVAEMLTKNLGVIRSTPGSIEKGMEIVNEYMKALGNPTGEFKLQNPSGFTRANRLSAKALWNVLWDMKSQLLFEPEFLTSLPIAGVDGTLKKRMKGTPAERWVRAKTGYLTNVVSLAGYAGRPDGRVIPFVLIYNGSADEGKVRSAFDQVMQVLVQ